ncbi:MAG: hypothetical protein SF066_06730 [Thermoanaerobaculia bacterium]|nr:hypothetical protein [Thermoanaerobaculia bacterium]
MNFGFGEDFLRGLATVGLVAAFGALSWSLASRLVARSAGPALRLAAALVVGFFTATAVIGLLGTAGLFRLGVLLPLLGALAVAAWRRWPAPPLSADLQAGLRRARELARRPAGWLLAGTLLWLAIAWLRGTIGPPMGWDGLTYHLLKAGRLVQTGGFVFEQAPDAWEYYEYFPVGGSLLWAWPLVLFGNTVLVTSFATLQWGAALLGLYATARELEAPPEAAATAAVAVVGMPTVLGWLSSAYVDNLTLAYFALGSLFLVRCLRSAPREALLAAAAFGLMAGVRVTALPLLGLALVLIAHEVWRVRRRLVWMAMLVATIGAPSYLRAWVEQGSPLYPLPFLSHPGSRMLAETLTSRPISGWLRTPAAAHADASLLYAPEPVYGWFLNPGPGLALLPVAALVGLFALGRRERRIAAFLAITSLLMIGSLWSEAMEIYRTGVWSHTSGRFALPGIAALAIFAAQSGAGLAGRVAQRLVAAAAALALVWAMPRGWSSVEFGGLLALLALAGTTALGLVLFVRRQPLRLPRLAAGALGLAAALALAAQLQTAARYALFAEADDAVLPYFQSHPLTGAYVGQWPLWQALDDGVPRRIATVAGWDGSGHNNYRFPLLGSRLQNTVVYVPITDDGSIVHALDEHAAADRLSFAAWRDRLVAAEIDVVASLPPWTSLEHTWMLRHPELFEPWLCTPNPRDRRHPDVRGFLFHRERVNARDPAGAAPGAPP